MPGVDGVWYCAYWGYHWGTKPVSMDESVGWEVVLCGTPFSHTHHRPLVVLR
ncbi:MAG: hypothetical protein GW893_09780 [Armatimonadetes bacterium]|nr:hypothetical protein [Armatimonadota bacterium]